MPVSVGTKLLPARLEQPHGLTCKGTSMPRSGESVSSPFRIVSPSTYWTCSQAMQPSSSATTSVTCTERGPRGPGHGRGRFLLALCEPSQQRCPISLGQDCLQLSRSSPVDRFTRERTQKRAWQEYGFLSGLHHLPPSGHVP